MPYCHKCGRYVGDYSAYSHDVPGKGPVPLCHRCKRWAERHPGAAIARTGAVDPQNEGKRIRTFSTIYVISAFGICALGVVLLIVSDRLSIGILFILGGLSLFFIGLGMRRFSEK